MLVLLDPDCRDRALCLNPVHFERGGAPVYRTTANLWTKGSESVRCKAVVPAVRGDGVPWANSQYVERDPGCVTLKPCPLHSWKNAM